MCEVRSLRNPKGGFDGTELDDPATAIALEVAAEGIVRAFADGGCVSELVASNGGAARDNFDLATLNAQ
jgi:hypothetical protein